MFDLLLFRRAIWFLGLFLNDVLLFFNYFITVEYDKNVMVKSAELTSSYNTDEEDNPAKKRKIKTNKSKSCSLPPLEQLPVLTTVKQVLHQSTDTLTLQRSHRKSLLGSVTSLQPRSDSPETGIVI